MTVESKSGSETKGYWRNKARECNCYCGIRDKDPNYFQERGVPDGYCGICVVCGKPGHTRHAPNRPYTSAWCDGCYPTPSKATPFITSFMLSSVAVALLAAIGNENLIFVWGGVGLVTIVLIVSWVLICNFAKISKMVFSILVHQDFPKAKKLYKELDVPSALLFSAFAYLPPPICYVIFRTIFPS